ncbi:MAG TPA: EAL domain-containing protein [Xanthobacteraceae bacterium]|nr:EAL domain-containing protein [Xanthobacteraceae bacterium]
MWREIWTGLNKAWAGGGDKRVRRSAVAPIVLIIVFALVCVIAAVQWSAHRADEVALHQERQLFAQAIAQRRGEILREVESIVTSDNAVNRMWIEFDWAWVHNRVGLRLQSYFEHNYIFAVDSSDEFTYAMAGRSSVDARWFGAATADLAAVIDAVRGRPSPLKPEDIDRGYVDPATAIERPARAARVQMFMGRPTIVAAVPVAPGTSQVAPPHQPPPILISVSYLYDKFLEAVSRRLELPNLRMIDLATPADNDNTYELYDETGRPMARFAWTPKRPGAEIMRNVMPFLGIALAAFVLLTSLVVRYMRRTEATIAAGEDQMRHLALHDALSSLPNRTFFGERLADLIEEVRRTGHMAAVLSIDLDRFKEVNDTLGHLIGDALIRSVGQRLARMLRASDLVARLGGDEFAVITPDVGELGDLQTLADRIIEALRAPYAIMGHTLAIGASIGITSITRESGEVADIMRRADVALYRAKNEGRNRACIYDAEMDADLRERKEMERDLKDAIEYNDLTIAYQPLVGPSGETMVGVEALCRWHHPTRGEIPPAKFIPIAEHSELIIPLGEWVLRQACTEARAWPGLPLSVNVSPLQFRRPDFVKVVARILAETGFAPELLELELTESTLVGNVEEAGTAMRELKALGVRFALDDFGTGYSSLLYLRTFPFDKLKIDRSFVRNIESAADSAAIVHAVVSLGRGLGMKVTAEGVETAEQHLFLRAAGVHSLQGFRFGHPGTAIDITARLLKQTGAAARARAPIASLAS